MRGGRVCEMGGMGVLRAAFARQVWVPAQQHPTWGNFLRFWDPAERVPVGLF